MNFYDEATGETYKGYKEEGYLPEAFVNFFSTFRMVTFR